MTFIEPIQLNRRMMHLQSKLNSWTPGKKQAPRFRRLSSSLNCKFRCNQETSRFWTGTRTPPYLVCAAPHCLAINQDPGTRALYVCDCVALHAQVQSTLQSHQGLPEQLLLCAVASQVCKVHNCAHVTCHSWQPSVRSPTLSHLTCGGVRNLGSPACGSTAPSGHLRL